MILTYERSAGCLFLLRSCSLAVNSSPYLTTESTRRVLHMILLPTTATSFEKITTKYMKHSNIKPTEVDSLGLAFDDLYAAFKSCGCSFDCN